MQKQEQLLKGTSPFFWFLCVVWLFTLSQLCLAANPKSCVSSEPQTLQVNRGAALRTSLGHGAAAQPVPPHSSGREAERNERLETEWGSGEGGGRRSAVTAEPTTNFTAEGADPLKLNQTSTSLGWRRSSTNNQTWTFRTQRKLTNSEGKLHLCVDISVFYSNAWQTETQNIDPAVLKNGSDRWCSG